MSPPSFPFHVPLVFVDLETTGANFANDRIIEIGIVAVSESGVEEWSSLVDPEQAVSPFITSLTGIDSAMVATAPTFGKLGAELLEKLKGGLFVAHNARFDYGFLRHEFRRIGVDFRATCLCTVKLSRRLFPEHHRHNLDTLVDRYGVDAGDRHRALADSRVLWKLWQRWHELLPADAIREAVGSITNRPAMPAHIDSSFLDDLPEAPGAYALYDETGETLLVKRGANLRQQLPAHFSRNSRNERLIRDTRRVEWREAAGELGARLHEIALAKAARRTCADLCSWQLIEHEKGDFRPRLVSADEIDFARSDNLFGLYATRREAQHALRKLAEAHRLCHTLLGLGTGKSGEGCAAYKQRNCRGACIGKESPSLHSVRLMTALAKYKLQSWPYPVPIALVERDEFGMREDFHVIDGWRYLGMASSETELHAILENKGSGADGFDAEIYRTIGKYLKAGKIRVLPLYRKA